MSKKKEVKNLPNQLVLIVPPLSTATLPMRSKPSYVDFDLDMYEKLFAVNVRGVAASVKYAARAMLEGGRKGSIICTQPASQPIPVEASIQIMSCPSVRYWGWPLGVEEVEKTFESTSCLKGVLKLKHVANAVLFLASEDSEFVTGHDLVVDGSEDLHFLNQANSILRCNKLKGNRQMVEPCVLFPDGSGSGAVHVRLLLSFRFRRKTKSLRLTSLPLYY
ncbi:hypothetical protein NC653_034828 [Populus alba x Populus x berolinensis]|uniref:Uncharacterized protein n=1 Tax=Populus alba x Populus x berolinensis TaxID=444605 RepID=A0AAD6PXK3_9ROSI|nr:hypothetical protein NC653_034828 [Populus alba x Populus x berolinensis]